jgi:hypothetical protein
MRPLVSVFLFGWIPLASLALTSGSESCFAVDLQNGGPGDRIVAQGVAEAAIENENQTEAGKKALSQALQAAFAKAMAESAPPSLGLSEQQALVNELSSRINEFLVQYRFQEIPADGTMSVTVEAAFSRSSFLDEFGRRGLLPREGESAVKPIVLYLTVGGIRDKRTYLAVRNQLPRRIERIRSLVPLEIFGEEMTLQVIYAGDAGGFEAAARKILQEIAQGDTLPGEGVTVTVSQVPPGARPPRGPPSGGKASPTAGVSPAPSR